MIEINCSIYFFFHRLMKNFVVVFWRAKMNYSFIHSFIQVNLFVKHWTHFNTPTIRNREREQSKERERKKQRLILFVTLAFVINYSLFEFLFSFFSSLSHYLFFYGEKDVFFSYYNPMDDDPKNHLRKLKRKRKCFCFHFMFHPKKK